MKIDIASLPLPVRLTRSVRLDSKALMPFSCLNWSFRLERERKSDTLVTTPTGKRICIVNSRMITVLDEWARFNCRGVTTDSDPGFNLDLGAVRSSDPKKWLTTRCRSDEETEILHDATSVQGSGPVRGLDPVISRVWGAA